jgi:glucuronate isomerase
MDEKFLLQNDIGMKLYSEYAKDMPIFDYHCHLSPREIAENKKYENLSEVWLGGDHYKWRAMRSNGVDEKYVTGDAADKEKFLKWAETMPHCLGNPLYHWTHLELKRYFKIDTLLNPDTAESIWEKCNELLQKEAFSARGLIKNSNVKVLCTTDDPADSLEYHLAIKKSGFEVKVLPACRPDKAFAIDKQGYKAYLQKLGLAARVDIKDVNSLKDALIKRLDFFHEVGCRVSDHGLDPIVFAECSDTEANTILQKGLSGKALSVEELEKFKSHILVFLGRQYNRLGWVMQLHIGVIRDNNKRMFKLLGPDTGFDSIGDYNFARALAGFLNKLEETGELTKTILYNGNPSDNEILGSLLGCFQGGGIPGKIQFGSGWWFNDQIDGMERHMAALAALGLLSRFVGMLTDSRSFLSYTRHEYFRRILCNRLGAWAERGEVPSDMALLGTMVQNICFNNAKNYFGIEL